MLVIVEKGEVSPASSFAFQCSSCGKSLMYTRRTGAKTEPCGTPASTRDHFSD